MEYAEFIELQPIDDRDDGQAASDLAGERRERTLLALYSAAMLGLRDDDLRILCAETGVSYAELEAYAPPILRLPNQPENQPTLDLPF